ncbi:hypothetical protein CBR_g3189 [Chara braunii]|uniref:Pentacotripeptide-repeat region of PRORP domain-containing protein n=1 Tax=Chara braunii TaxID=69332 RepID=A0A388KF14_CHABU|nr:hypothetical protein CBR_g3189 [Chara braunii]|eukprot:GBG68648.1 hypothetical protein CBR_g3189 [Chara braunii]
MSGWKPTVAAAELLSHLPRSPTLALLSSPGCSRGGDAKLRGQAGHPPGARRRYGVHCSICIRGPRRMAAGSLSSRWWSFRSRSRSDVAAQYLGLEGGRITCNPRRRLLYDATTSRGSSRQVFWENAGGSSFPNLPRGGEIGVKASSTAATALTMAAAAEEEEEEEAKDGCSRAPRWRDVASGGRVRGGRRESESCAGIWRKGVSQTVTGRSWSWAPFPGLLMFRSSSSSSSSCSSTPSKWRCHAGGGVCGNEVRLNPVLKVNASGMSNQGQQSAGRRFRRSPLRRPPVAGREAESRRRRTVVAMTADMSMPGVVGMTLTVGEGLMRHTKKTEKEMSAKVYQCVMALCAAEQLGDGVEKVLDAWADELAMADVMNVLKELVNRSRNAEKLMMVFDWLRGSGASVGLEPNVRTYTFMIRAMGRFKRYETAAQLFRDMRFAGVEPDSFAYNAMIGGYARNNEWKKVFGLYEEMFRGGVFPDQVTYVELVSGLCKAGMLKEAKQVLLAMKQQGVRGNLPIYKAAIFAAVKEKDLDAAIALHQRMESEGVEPDESLSNLLITAYGKKGMCEYAERVFQDMAILGLKRERTTYNQLIVAYSKSARQAEAEGVLQDMKADGLTASTVTYNALMEGYSVQGLYDEASAVFQDMLQEGIRPDLNSFNNLIKAYVKGRQLAWAESVMHDMREQGIRPNVLSYVMLVEGYARVGMLVDAERMLHEAKDMGHTLPEKTLSVLMGFYEKSRSHTREAVEKVKVMKVRMGMANTQHDEGNVKMPFLKPLAKDGRGDLAWEFKKEIAGLRERRAGVGGVNLSLMGAYPQAVRCAARNERSQT